MLFWAELYRYFFMLVAVAEGIHICLSPVQSGMPVLDLDPIGLNWIFQLFFQVFWYICCTVSDTVQKTATALADHRTLENMWLLKSKDQMKVRSGRSLTLEKTESRQYCSHYAGFEYLLVFRSLCMLERTESRRCHTEVRHVRAIILPLHTPLRSLLWRGLNQNNAVAIIPPLHTPF